MKRVLILCRTDERTDYDQIQTFAKGLAEIETKCTYSFGLFEQLLFRYDGEVMEVLSDGVDIKSYDSLFMIGWFKTKILEDVAMSAATYMDHHQKTVRNTEALYTRSRSKLSQYVTAALHGINLPPFVFAMDTAILLRTATAQWSSDYPVILKGVQASRGNDNYLITNEQEMQETIALSDPEQGPWFVAQSYVPNDGDYRVIVMGNKVVKVIHRKSLSASHLNNTSKGGVATLEGVDSIPKDTQTQCVLLAQLLRREVTGVDMIRHRETGVLYLLEINNMPQMATGSFVAEKLTALDGYFAGELS